MPKYCHFSYFSEQNAIMDFKLSLIGSTKSQTPSLTTFIDSTFSPEKSSHLLALGSDSGDITIWQCPLEELHPGSPANSPQKFQINQTKPHPIIASLAHDAQITFLKFTKFLNLLSGDKNGNLYLWDKSYGRLLAKTILPSQIDTFCENKENYFLSGQFSEVLCLSKKDLSIQKRLSARLYPDWICGVFNFKNQIVGLTVTGFLKIWYLESTQSLAQTNATSQGQTGQSGQSGQTPILNQNTPILEDEVRKLTTDTPISILCNKTHFVILSLTAVEIFNVGDFSKYGRFSLEDENESPLDPMNLSSQDQGFSQGCGQNLICGGVFDEERLYVYEIMGQVFYMDLKGNFFEGQKCEKIFASFFF